MQIADMQAAGIDATLTGALDTFVAAISAPNVDQAMLELVRAASLTETAVNSGLPTDSRTSRYSNSIREDGTFSGAVRLPVNVDSIQVII